MQRRGKGRPPYDDVLTPAEWRIAHAVRHGMTNRTIAERRGISLDAVKFHVANIVAKLELANRRALRHWAGIPKQSALNAQELPVSDQSMQLGRIGQISRSVKNIARSEAWYRDVLGLPHLYTFGELAFFDCKGTRLFLTQAKGEPPAESVLYLQVDDIRQAHAELQNRGVEFINAPHLIHKHADGTEEWMAFFKDLEARPLALISQVKP